MSGPTLALKNCAKPRGTAPPGMGAIMMATPSQMKDVAKVAMKDGTRSTPTITPLIAPIPRAMARPATRTRALWPTPPGSRDMFIAMKQLSSEIPNPTDRSRFPPMRITACPMATRMSGEKVSTLLRMTWARRKLGCRTMFATIRSAVRRNGMNRELRSRAW